MIPKVSSEESSSSTTRSPGNYLNSKKVAMDADVLIRPNRFPPQLATTQVEGMVAVSNLIAKLRLQFRVSVGLVAGRLIFR